jgi:hypothetical protein
VTAILASAAPALAPRTAAAARPVIRLTVTVKLRPLVARCGLAWFAGQAALMVALGVWLADPRLAGVATFDLALGACFAWYLRYPIGVYEAASNTYVEVWPFGLSWKRLPGRPEQTLGVQGRRIVLTGSRTRTVLSRSLTHRVHYVSVARLVRKARHRTAVAPDHPPRPGFVSRRHRIAGWAVIGSALAGLLYQFAPMPVVVDLSTVVADLVASVLGEGR